MQFYWFLLLLSAICLEGLGRKYLPGVPSVAFYFFKDAVLIAGYFILKPPAEVRMTARWLFRGFPAVLIAAIVWTTIEIFNPQLASIELGVLGLRAYWLWWFAPIVVASALRGVKYKNRAIYTLLFMSLGIAALAAVQFTSSPSSAVNLYSTYEGQEIYAADMATVASTGRARVSGTFSFLSGFVAFTVVVPALLLSLGLEARDKKLRRASLVGTLVCAAVLPMSGSRGAIVLAAGVLVITAWTAGLLFTVVGRRVIVGAFLAVTAATVVFP